MGGSTVNIVVNGSVTWRISLDSAPTRAVVVVAGSESTLSL
jgi:hypothetical protein